MRAHARPRAHARTHARTHREVSIISHPLLGKTKNGSLSPGWRWVASSLFLETVNPSHREPKHTPNLHMSKRERWRFGFDWISVSSLWTCHCVHIWRGGHFCPVSSLDLVYCTTVLHDGIWISRQTILHTSPVLRASCSISFYFICHGDCGRKKKLYSCILNYIHLLLLLKHSIKYGFTFVLESKWLSVKFPFSPAVFWPPSWYKWIYK